MPVLPRSPYDVGGWMNQDAPQLTDSGDWWSQNAPAPVNQPMQQGLGALSPQQAFMDYVQSHGIAPQQSRGNLRPIADALNQQYGGGWSAAPNAGDWIGYQGQGFDVLPAGDANWQWLNDPADSTAGQGGGLAGLGGGGLTPEQIMQQDPGYQFRLGQGLQALQRSAAARGTLLTGGTQKALERYGQDYASGEFGNVFNRNFNLAQLGKPQ